MKQFKEKNCLIFSRNGIHRMGQDDDQWMVKIHFVSPLYLSLTYEYFYLYCYVFTFILVYYKCYYFRAEKL